MGAKGALKAIAMIVAALLLLAGVVLGLIQLRPVKTYAASLIAKWIGSKADIEIHVEGISGWVPFSLEVNKAALSDAEGIFSEILGLQIRAHPLGILGHGPMFREISARAVRIHRLPREREAKATKPPSFPTSILALPALRIGIHRLVLGPEVVAGGAVLSVEGRLSAPGGSEGQKGSLHIWSAEGRTLDATISWTTGQGGMHHIEVEASDRQGGPLIKLIGLEGVHSLEFSLRGLGNLRAWDGRLRIGLGGLGVLNSDLSISKGPKVSINGKWTPKGQLLKRASIPRLLLREAAFSSALDCNKSRPWELVGRVQWGTGTRLVVKGILDLHQSKIQLNLNGSSDEPPALLPLPAFPVGGRVSFWGGLGGRWNALQGVVKLLWRSPSVGKSSGDELGLEGQVWSLKGTEGRVLKVWGRAWGRGLRSGSVPSYLANPVVDFSLQKDPNGRVLLRDLSLSAQPLVLDLIGTMEKGGLFSGSASISIREGAQWPSPSIPLEMPVPLKIKLEGMPLKGNLHGRLKGRLRATSRASSFLPADLLDLEGQILVKKGRTVHINYLRLKGPGTRGEIRGTLDLAEKRIALKGGFRCQPPKGAFKEGTRNMSYSSLDTIWDMRGTMTMPTFSATVKANDFRQNGLEMKEIHLRITGRGPPSKGSGILEVTLKRTGQVIRGKAAFRLGKGELLFSPVSLWGKGGIVLEGRASVSRRTQGFQSGLHAEIMDLESLGKFFGVMVKGGTSVEAMLSKAGKTMKASFSAEAEALRLPFVDAHKLAIRGYLKSESGCPSYNVRLSSSWIKSGRLAVRDPQLEVEVRPPSIKFKGYLAQTALKMAPGKQIRLEMTQFSGEARWGVDLGNATGYLLLRRKTQEEGKAKGPQPAPVEANVTASLSSPHTAHITGKVVGLGGEPLAMDLYVPIIGDTLYPIQVDPEGSLKGQLNGQLEIETLKGWIVGIDPGLGGKALVDIQLSGTPGKPHLQGSISISNARFQGASR